MTVTVMQIIWLVGSKMIYSHMHNSDSHTDHLAGGESDN